MNNRPDFKQYCEPACVKLWGEPDKRTNKELRWNGGDAYSTRTYTVSRRAWYDHGSKRGGSTLHLVDYTKGRPQRDLRGSIFFDVWREANEMGIVPDPAPPKPNGGSKWPILATYPYHDENGVLLFEVVRFDTTPKDAFEDLRQAWRERREGTDERFRQRQPDGKGDWIWNLKGVRRVLYRLPELIAAVKAEQLVLLTEGEKDANTAVKLGYAATTMPGGADKWRSEYDEFLRDADVVIVSDNDPQLKDKNGKLQFHPNGDPILRGQDHAAKLAKRLSKVAARVRVIMFEVKDLSDWVAAGGTREQLDEIIAKATEPPPPDDDEIEKEIARLAALPFPSVEFDRECKASAKKLGSSLSTLKELVAEKRNPSGQHDGGLEDKVALEFSAKYAGNVRYVHKWGMWFFWDGVRWVEEQTLQAFHLARELARAAEDAAHKTVAAVVGLARTDPRQAAKTEQWDTDPWLLGTPKGTIDLRTGKLLPPKPADYITKITAVAPSNEPPRDSCPMWLTFLNRVMNGNEELQDYLQRICGYCLTGITTEDAVFFHYGLGDNGKSVYSDTIAGILNDYHETADMELFVVTHSDKHPTDLASLRGARMVTAVETEEGKRWAEAKLKKMTGGNPIKARFMRQDFFTYIPQFKLNFEGNHKPAIRNVDKAISRRMNLIPWLVTISEKEKDKDLSDKLKAEWPGILRWMIDGCLAWKKIGLKPPKIVTASTTEYLESEDTARNFFEDCCVIAKGESDSFEHIWDGYVDWCEDCHEFVGTKKSFGQKLKDKGFQMIQYGPNRAYTYIGIRCIRENKKKLMEEARRRTEELRQKTEEERLWRMRGARQAPPPDDDDPPF
jgi:putative DNA primase/helicase